MTCRKVISVILSLVIAFSIIAIPASADEIDTITVHYYNENNWSNPYIYYYYGGNTGNSWPGNSMSFEGDGWYSYTIYNYSTAYVIFSDNGSNQNPAQNEQGFQVSDEMWYYKGSWSTERPENVYTIVHYYNDNNWSTPYIYYYTDNNNPVSWPGNAMVSEGGNWYTFTIPDLANPKVIFSNNGSNQNPAQNQPSFDVSGEKWYLNGTFYDSEPEGITVHYHNYDNWNNVNIYYYDGERTGNNWTGNPMISDGDGWYTYKIYGFDSVKVLFNNGGNIQIPGQYEPGFDVSGEMWYRNGEWTTERPDEITVFFYKPENWGTPNIYYYKNNNDTGPTWPGEQMTSEGENWYSFTITKYDEANVLFNSNSNQIPAQNQPGFVASGVMWYKDGVWCNSESDSDNDDLPDFMEMILGTNLNSADSDGDGLPDGLEVLILGTDPLKTDSDENGVNDGAEDADNDGLTNLQEYTLGTDPTSADSDGDGLIDGDEVTIYHTDPLKVDTDDDGLSDYDEVQLGLNPLSEDSNNDGILDCDEKIQQTISEEIICEDKPAVTGVTVSFAGTGNIETTTTIDNIYNIDVSSSGVVGLIGAPVEISSTSQFDSAVITFNYDELELGDVPETNLSIMWYDEENDLYIILDQDSVIDTVNNTVSYTTTHFSKYMLVDKQQWYDTWRLNIDYRSGSYNPTYYDFSFVVDTSGSMSGSRIDCAKTALNHFIDSLSSNDHAGLVQFDSNASVVCSMGTSKQGLKSGVSTLSASGGTSVSQGLSVGINQLMSYNTGNPKAVILICDGDVDSVSSVVDIAYNNSIKIYTVNVVSSNHSELQSIASYTGGEYYYASNSSDLITQMDDLCGGTLYGIDLSDSDGDGLPDTFERNGMRLSNGRIITTDPFNPDSDYDGISDGDEMGALSLGSGVHIEGLNFDVIALEDSVYIGDGESISNAIYFRALSYPNSSDSDGDFLLDGSVCMDDYGNIILPKDPHPINYNGPNNIWEQEYNRYMTGMAAHNYTDYYSCEIDENTRKLILLSLIYYGSESVINAATAANILINTQLGTDLGSHVLTFPMDEYGTVLHARPETWQSLGGYNFCYDIVFTIGTIGQARNEKFEFNCNGNKYRMWVWRGDYLNLGAGAELGIYKDWHNPLLEGNIDIHWAASDINFQMTQSLYMYDNGVLDCLSTWAPTEEQWWICSFDPSHKHPNASDLVSIEKVDFSNNTDAYQDFKSKNEKDLDLYSKYYFAFDDDNYLVWLVWSDKKCIY